MLIVLIWISIFAIFVLYFTDNEELCLIPVFLLVIFLCAFTSCLVSLIGYKTINNKIKLYETQNKEIETKVGIVVKQYMQYEHDTFVELKNDTSYMTLVTLYPELKSDELIKKEIELYEQNNKKILELKEQKIDEKIYKWWIYFG